MSKEIKKCPKCGSKSLKERNRYNAEQDKIIMVGYKCDKCGEKINTKQEGL